MVLIFPSVSGFVLSNALVCLVWICLLPIAYHIVETFWSSSFFFFFLFFWTLFFVSLVNYFWHWFSSAISCCIILWGTGVFLAGTCSSSLFWDKGRSCLCILYWNCSPFWNHKLKWDNLSVHYQFVMLGIGNIKTLNSEFHLG